MNERVLERANKRYGLFAHWCPVGITEAKRLYESMVRQ